MHLLVEHSVIIKKCTERQQLKLSSLCFSGQFTGSRKYRNLHYSQLRSLASDLCHGKEVSDIPVTFIASFCISELWIFRYVKRTTIMFVEKENIKTKLSASLLQTVTTHSNLIQRQNIRTHKLKPKHVVPFMCSKLWTRVTDNMECNSVQSGRYVPTFQRHRLHWS